MSEAEIERISNENFTCINCNVKFHTADIQREHYKTDWHRYNLKRRIADLPPVTAESFQLRVIQQRNEDQIALEQTATTSRCTKCQKVFNSIQARDNHLNSRKHKEKMKQCEKPSLVLETTPILPETTQQVKVTSINKEPFVMVTTDGNGDVDIEEVDSDEWDDIENPIINDDCLFCANHSDDFVANLKHMSIAHSFFVPDTDYVCNLEGLLMYLGEKITRDFICIWCNDSGKTFYSLDAVRKHMNDKGHCKMLHEGLSLAEYTDFYDYSASYPDKVRIIHIIFLIYNLFACLTNYVYTFSRLILYRMNQWISMKKFQQKL